MGKRRRASSQKNNHCEALAMENGMSQENWSEIWATLTNNSLGPNLFFQATSIFKGIQYSHNIPLQEKND